MDFQDLKQILYDSGKVIDGFEHVYAPLYLWENEKGMKKFLLEGNHWDRISIVSFKVFGQ